jgi:hypothetical protein
MSYRYLRLDSLVINRANDRHGELENETAAIAWLFNNFELHMRNLAKDIVANAQVFEPPLDSSLRDVKEDDSNNEVAPSRGGEQIDDVLDGFVGAVVGGFKSAVWAILRVRTAVEAAVGKWSAQPFVEEQKKQRDLNTL